MPLDPHAEAFLKYCAMSGPAVHELPVDSARAATDRLVIVCGGSVTEPVTVQERRIAAPGRAVPVRIYTPQGTGAWPVVVYAHGGGWVTGSLDMAHAVCARLAHQAQAVVVSVDYRLAPEHPYPAAVGDVWWVAKTLAQQTSEVAGDGRLAVAGDSAGGQLAAATAGWARALAGPRLAALVLIAPVVTHTMSTRSWREHDGTFLSGAMMRWFLGHYASLGQARASPLHQGDASGLPATWLATAEYDPLRDDAESYAGMLHRAGVPVQAHRYEGQIHCVVPYLGAMPVGERVVADAAAWLRSVFAIADPLTETARSS